MKLKFPWQKVQLIKACIEFADMRLWERYDNMDFFVLETPLEDPVVASIMGTGGHEYGLCVFRGPDAFGQPFLLDKGEKAAVDMLYMIGFNMEQYGDMDHFEKRWFKSCNYRASKSDLLPSFISKRPGQMGEMLEKDRDVKLMLYIAKGIIKAQNDGKFHPATMGLSGSEMLTIMVSGDVLDPDVDVTHKFFPGSKELLTFCNDSTFDCWQPSTDISNLPRLEETWVVVPGYISAVDTGGDNCLFVVAKEDSCDILCATAVPMIVSELMETFCGIFAGDNAAESVGVPQKIVIAEIDLFNAINGVLQKIGIDVRYKKNHRVAKKIRKSLERNMPAFMEEHFVGKLEIPEIDLSIVPKDDDIAGWKAVQLALTNQFINFWHDADYLRKTRPGKKFFGERDWQYYLDEYRDLMALPGYVTWAALTYRTMKSKPTFAEKLLAGDMPEALRISLESLNNSYPSLYQIMETDPETGHLVLKDLLLSGTVTVHDQGLSQTAKAGWIAPFWVHSLGNTSFVDIAGAMFSPMDATEIIQELQDLKLPAEPTPKWLRENAHVFGQLWLLFDEIAESNLTPPNLANTDGDVLKFITADFKCENHKKTRKALQLRNDIDYDKNSNEYIWFKDTTGGSPMGTTLLGRIFFEGSKLKIEVNSKERLDRLIDILEAIDGVRYLDYHTREMEDIFNEVSESENEDVFEEKVPEEVIAEVQANMYKYYMNWLDTKIPALDNKTPRDAAKNKKGAQKVRMLIETISIPVNNTGIEVPKKAMLEELGFNEK